MRNDLQRAIDTLQSSISISKTFKEKKPVIVPIDTAIAALTALRDALQRQPDPDTGLVPCGCGGKAKIWLSDFTRYTHLITDYEAGCTECAMTTGWVRGKQENAMNVWNTAMGWKGGAEE